jgi:adenosylhomocysteine nucleosidase
MDKRIILFVALESELPKNAVPYEVDVYYTGVGKVNAAIKSTQVLSQARNYDRDVLVVNYGSAGSNTLPVGTLVECKQFIQQDMDTPFGEKYSTPFDEILHSQLKESVLTFGDGELCRTQDKFEMNPNGVFDMEAYSIAKVCKLNRFDFVSYKYISDSGASDDWNVNHSKGINKFLDVLNKLI